MLVQRLPIGKFLVLTKRLFTDICEQLLKEPHITYTDLKNNTNATII